MPPLTYIHASEAARTTAGGRGVGDSKITPPPTAGKGLGINENGARVAGVHKARLCPACSRKRDIPFLSPFSLPPRGEEAQTCLFARIIFRQETSLFQ